MCNKNLKHRFYAKISYTMDEEHPDIKCVPDWTENKIYTFEDVYYFHNNYTKEEVETYIKRDMELVAGGGYNADHIHNVTFEIKQA
jgi:hypothetical protein